MFSEQDMEEQAPKPLCWHMMPRNRFGHPLLKIICLGLSILKHIAARLESRVGLFWVSTYSSKDFNPQALATRCQPCCRYPKHHINDSLIRKLKI